MGHDTLKCTKAVVRHEWRMKKPHVQTKGKKQNHITEGQMTQNFQPVRNLARRSLSCYVDAPIQNTFDALEAEEGSNERDPIKDVTRGEKESTKAAKVMIGMVACGSIGARVTGGSQPLKAYG